MAMAVQKYYWECPSCNSRYFNGPPSATRLIGGTLVVSTGCPQCFSNLVRRRLAPGDPTFGLTSTGSTAYPATDTGFKDTAGAGSLASGYLYGQKFTQGSKAGTLQAISFYAYANVDVGVALYSHDGANDKPASPLTTKQSVSVGAGWPKWVTVTMTVANRIDIAANASYWIVFEMSAASGVAYKGNGGRRSYKTSWTYGNPFPDPWGTSAQDATYQALVYWTHIEIKGYAKATKVTLADKARIDSFSFYSHADGHVRLGFFSDSSGPATKLWESGSVVCTAAAWCTVNTSDGTPAFLCPIDAGTYWLAWQWDSGAAGPSYTAGSSGDGNYIVQAYGAFPATWTGGTSTAETWSEYGTYVGPVISVTDSMVVTDSLTALRADLAATESIAITETLTGNVSNITVDDALFLADIAYFTQDTTTIDNFSLPHVQRISIVEKSVVGTKLVPGEVPSRKVQGKMGREIEIEGRTKLLSEIESVKALTDGESHLLTLPTGDTMTVHITNVNDPRSVDRYGRYVYILRADERAD